MEIKDTKEILSLQKQLDELSEARERIDEESRGVLDKIADAVKENVRAAFRDFRDGDKVRVTYKRYRGADLVEETKELFFHQPEYFGPSRGTYYCQYEIPFHDARKDGTESKRDRWDCCIPVHQIMSIEKI